MDKLIIHNPRSKHDGYYRYHNFFWDALTTRLSRYFDVHENRYAEFLHTDRALVKLQARTVEDFFLHECDYVIENITTGDFYILSTADVLHYNITCEHDNPHLKQVLFAQYIEKIMQYNVPARSLRKYSPWLYFQSQPFDLEELYHKRLRTKKSISKLYFRGLTRDRPILQHLSSDILDNTDSTDRHTYLNELLNVEVALSLGGVADICYRDIEYMALGIPFIRFEFPNRFREPLIPNVHYISVERPLDLPTLSYRCGVGLDRMGTAEHAKLIEQRYLEVIDNKDFLRYIGENAREYYEKYLMYPNNVNNTIDWLGILK